MARLFTFIKKLAPYLLVIWVVIILTFSSLTKLPAAIFNAINLEIRIDYILHFMEYLALGFLAALTFTSTLTSLRSSRLRLLILFLIIFASLDESHQLLIPGRSFGFSDLASNILGIFVGSWLAIILNRKYYTE